MKLKLSAIEFLNETKRKVKIFYKKATETRVLFAILPSIWILLFLAIPLLIVLKISFSDTSFSSPPFSDVFSKTADYVIKVTVSFKAYLSSIKDSYYMSAFLNSLYIGVITTIACFTIGFTMAYGIYSAKEKNRSTLLFLVSLSFWTSFLIRIYAWMNLLSVHGFFNSFLLRFGFITEPIQFVGNYYSVCLGLIFCYLPFMIFPIYAILTKLDKSFIEASYDLGAPPFITFWKITIPLSKHGIISGCTLVFTSSIGEFVVPELLGGPDTITFGRILWNEFFSNTDWPMTCALSIIMILFVILPVFVLQKKTEG